jgi:anti-anti-sigma factor
MALEVNTSVKSPGVFVVAPIGSIDGADKGLLEEKIDSVLKLNPEVIVFDMEQADYINSMGIRVLVKTKKAMQQRRGKIAFTNLQPQIKKVFDIINAMPAFKVFASVQEFDDYLWSELKKD